MRDRIVYILAIAWMASIALCCMGLVKVFGPLSVLLVGAALAADRSQQIDRVGLVVATFVTGGAVFFGIQQYQQRLGQIAYWAHRQYIGCKDADRWDAMGGKSDYPFQKPSAANITRCSELDDSVDFQVRLKQNGW